MKIYEVFFNDKRMKARMFKSHSVEDILRVLAMHGIEKNKIKQIQSEGRIIKL